MRTHIARAHHIARTRAPAGQVAWDAIGGLADAKIAAIPASGLIFKDILNVNRVRDPKVEGVELYVSDFQRGISDRRGSDFFGDPTSAALACAKVGRVRVDPVAALQRRVPGRGEAAVLRRCTKI